MSAYYNEHDPFAAAWLRELIKDGLIAPGEVDERSIEDVTPDELRSFQQCHFFAGIGVWSLAARRAGIADDAPLWTGSCPCQPFSAAGKGGGFADERHLWPAFHYLIEQCGPALVAGEQVAGADGDAWFDLVSADLDATGYAFGAAETCAAGFGAPHERSRNYWMAHRIGARLEGFGGHGDDGHQSGRVGADTPRSVAEGGISGGLADTGREQRKRGAAISRSHIEGSSIGGESTIHDQRLGAIGGMAVTTDVRHERAGIARRRGDGLAHGRAARVERPGATNGLWRDADWIRCRDEPVPKWRPIEPGSFPLVNAGVFRNRVGLLRGAGNACTLGQAEGFLEAVMASLPK